MCQPYTVERGCGTLIGLMGQHSVGMERRPARIARLYTLRGWVRCGVRHDTCTLPAGPSYKPKPTPSRLHQGAGILLPSSGVACRTPRTRCLVGLATASEQMVSTWQLRHCAQSLGQVFDDRMIVTLRHDEDSECMHIWDRASATSAAPAHPCRSIEWLDRVQRTLPYPCSKRSRALCWLA